MRILAMDSSGLVASVALVEDDVTIAEYSVNYKKTHSQTLLPMLDEISKMIELDLNSVDALAVSAGPGSFTGLRIGSATVKGLGLALNKPVIGVPTMEAMAMNAYGMTGLIVPMMDARRNQVFTGIYRFETVGSAGNDSVPADSVDNRDHETRLQLITVEDQMGIDICELLEKLNGYGESIVFLGDAVTLHKERIAEKLTVPYSYAPAHMNRQRASAVAALAMAGKGEKTSAADHKPDYLRVSQAEREKAERQGTSPEAEAQNEPAVRRVDTSGK